MKYMIINMKALEPLKITDNGLEDTLKTISGTMIKGAFFKEFTGGKILKEENEKDKEKFKEFQKLLKEKNLYFYDGYLKKDGNYFVPSPLCFIVNKHKLKNFSEDEPIENIKNVFKDEFIEGDVNLDKFEYCFINDKQMNVTSIDIRENIHITKKMKEGNIFRYQAIEKGQEFYSVVKGSENRLKKVKEYLENKEIYLGGSKGTGYGKVKIGELEIKDFSKLKEKIFKSEEKEEKKLRIYFYTKTVIKDEFGNTTSTIPTEYLSKKLDISNVKLEKQIAKIFNISGYNNTWKIALPKETAIKEGSIMEFSYYGELKQEKIDELEKNGIGYMKDRGFGQIFINPNFLDVNKLVKYKSKKNEEKSKYEKIEDENYKNILKNIIRGKEKRFIDRRVIDLQKSGKIRINILNNQIQNVLSIIENGKNGNFQFEDKSYLEDLKQVSLFGEKLKESFSKFSDLEGKLIGKEEYKRKELKKMEEKIKEDELFRSDFELAKEILKNLFYYKIRSNKEVKKDGE